MISVKEAKSIIRRKIFSLDAEAVQLNNAIDRIL